MILTFHSTSVPLTPEESATRTFAALDCEIILVVALHPLSFMANNRQTRPSTQ